MCVCEWMDVHESVSVGEVFVCECICGCGCGVSVEMKACMRVSADAGVVSVYKSTCERIFRETLNWSFGK